MSKIYNKYVDRNFIILFILITIQFIVIYYPYIFFNNYPFLLNDWYYQYLPDYKFLSDALHNGTFPFWTNKIGSGFPLISYGYNSYYNPFHILVAYFIENPRDGIMVMFYIAYILGAISIYIALRLLNFRNIIVIYIGVFAYLSTYFFMPFGNFYPLQLSEALSPIIFVLLYKILYEFDKKYLIWFISLTVLMLTAFYPSYQLRFFIVINIFFMVFAIKDKKFKEIFMLLLGYLIVLIFIYPQIKPTYELLKIGDIKTRDLKYFLDMSLHPNQIFNLFHSFWFSDLKNYIEKGWYYFRLPSIFIYLSFISLFYIKRYRIVLILWLITILSILFAFGENCKLYYFLAENNLIFSQRIPSRFLYLLNFTIPMLSIFGIKYLFDEIENKYKLIRIIVILLLIFFIQLFWTYHYFNKFDISLTLFFNSIDYSPILLFLLIFFSKNIFTLLLLVFVVTQDIIHKIKHYTIAPATNYNEIFTKTSFYTNKHKLITFNKWNRTLENITAEINIFYNIDSANTYSEALIIKNYKNFLLRAKQELYKNGSILKYQQLGVDGILTQYKIKNTSIKPLKLNKKLYLYPLPYKGIVWSYNEKNGFKHIKYTLVEEGNDIVINFEIKQQTDIIIFINKFYFFDVYLNKKLLENTESYYSFYKLKDIKNGKHVIKIQFSFLNLLNKGFKWKP